jgi:hypothetical protein
MKTNSTLRTLLPLSLAGLLVACASPTSSTNSKEGDDTSGDPPASTTPAPKAAAPASPAPIAPAPAALPPPAPVVPAIATAKVHAAPVWTYAVANDAVWVATDTSVERTAADGTGAAEIPALAAAFSLATDGARVYAFLDNGNAELFSMKSDGTDGKHHLDWSWNNGDPSALTVSGGRVYFTATRSDRPSQSAIISASAVPPLGGGNASTTVEDYVDAQSLPPAFTADRLFSVDYYRGSAATRMMLADTSKSVDVVHADVPTSAAGIATDGVDVYTRTAQGIVKVAIGSAQGTAATVVVPSATCSVFDPADGSSSVLDDALVIDGANIYTACRAGANVEVRAYAKAGTLAKVVASAPYNGGLSHLRVTSTAIYWMSKTAATSSDDELWRAAK